MGYKHNKEDILQIGYDVLRKNGYHNVGINQILKEAGIPKGSFYNFFESKEDFARQVVEQYGKSNTVWMQRIFDDSNLSPINTLRSFYQLLIDINEKDAYASGCLLNVMGNEVGRLNKLLAEEVDLYFRGWLNVIAGVVTKGQESGEITKRFSAHEIAEYLHAGFYGSISRMMVTRNREYMDTWLHITFDFIKK
ncbi:MAG: TetR/AcrR family transcriptional regulator [Bacteroidota bacterium]